MRREKMGALSESVKGSARAGTAWGFAVMIAGMLAIMAPFIMGVGTTMLLAILVSASGMMTLIYSFKAGSFGKGVLQFLFGGITIVAGIFMFLTPLLGMLTITGVLLVYFFIDGVFGIIAGFNSRPATGWGWIVVSGIASIALAYFLYSDWPVSGQYAIGILIGIRLIFVGWTIAMLGVAGDSVGDEIEEITG
jgi:uncharacterized membrane protein HdeD (DUF308 family)